VLVSGVWLLLIAAVVSGTVVVVVGEVRHRVLVVRRKLGVVRAVAPHDLSTASEVHAAAVVAARRVPARALADTDQWLLDVGPVAAIPHAAPDEPRHRFGVVARPSPWRTPEAAGLDGWGTARIRPVSGD
jgi:hypothetical protein